MRVALRVEVESLPQLHHTCLIHAALAPAQNDFSAGGTAAVAWCS